MTNVEGDAVQSSALAITVHDILHRNNSRFDSEAGFSAGHSKWSLGGHRPFYDETLFSGSRSYRFSSPAWDTLFKRHWHVPPHLNSENDGGREKQCSNGNVGHG